MDRELLKNIIDGHAERIIIDYEAALDRKETNKMIKEFLYRHEVNEELDSYDYDIELKEEGSILVGLNNLNIYGYENVTLLIPVKIEENNFDIAYVYWYTDDIPIQQEEIDNYIWDYIEFEAIQENKIKLD